MSEYVGSRPDIKHEISVNSSNNFVYLGGVPVFYWPTIATQLNKPTYYLNRFSVKNDSVYGTQVLTDWDMYQILGIRNPLNNTDWNATLDVLSERGIGFGTDARYAGDQILGIPGPFHGRFDAWGIFEQGLDNLGRDRRALVPEKEFRGRVFGQDRHRFANGWQLFRETGWISDRNFLEQYYEREWDEQKDQANGGELKRILDNKSFSISLDTRLNDFFTQTEWLPRLDHCPRNPLAPHRGNRIVCRECCGNGPKCHPDIDVSNYRICYFGPSERGRGRAIRQRPVQWAHPARFGKDLVPVHCRLGSRLPRRVHNQRAADLTLPRTILRRVHG